MESEEQNMESNEREAKRRKFIHKHIIVTCVAAAVLIREIFLHRIHKSPSSYNAQHRLRFLNDIINDSDTECRNQLRMNRAAFYNLRDKLRDSGRLNHTRGVTMEETHTRGVTMEETHTRGVTGVDGPLKETQSQPIDDYYPNLDGLGEFSSADVEELVYGDMRTPESFRKDVPKTVRKGVTGTAGSKLSSSDQRSTCKRKANDDAVEACGNLTKVVEKLAATLEMDNEFTRAKVLKEAIKSVKGINREEVSATFRILIQDKFKALDFWTTEEDERTDFLRSLLYS